MLRKALGLLEELEQPVFLVMDLFGLIKNPNPKVKVGMRPRTAHEVPLLQATASRVVNMEETPTFSNSTRTPFAMEKSPLDFADEDVQMDVVGEHQTDKLVSTTVPQQEQPAAKSAATESVSEPEPLSFAVPLPTPEPDIAQSSKAATVEDEDTKKSSCHLDNPLVCQELVDHIIPPGCFSEMRHLPSEDFLSQYNINMARQVALGSQLRLRFEQESKLLKKSVAKIGRREQKIKVQEDKIKNLESLIEAESDMKRAVEAKNKTLTKELEDLRAHFSKLQVDKDKRVEQRCAEMDARLDALSIDFDEELYPHMLTAIADVVTAGIEKGLSDGLRDDVEHGNLVGLRVLKVPLIDCNSMASLHLESDTSEDAPPEVRGLGPCTSQLKIPVYPEVRDPRNPWPVREEILLEDAIAANISRAEKKKKKRVVCRTHGVGSAHHARSDGVPVSVPVVPQGLQVVLTDASTQTDMDIDNSPQRLTRASFVPLL
ncbi:hypothetical protein Tco_0911093 [Tanacetum coccineum]|uniref:Uncharacterized protein n=1 Tax=Tanacetum coccineum TaxID=301880 RepID=A0ABQ5CV50_9ASTR